MIGAACRGRRDEHQRYNSWFQYAYVDYVVDLKGGYGLRYYDAPNISTHQACSNC